MLNYLLEICTLNLVVKGFTMFTLPTAYCLTAAPLDLKLDMD